MGWDLCWQEEYSVLYKVFVFYTDALFSDGADMYAVLFGIAGVSFGGVAVWYYRSFARVVHHLYISQLVWLSKLPFVYFSAQKHNI